jgi:hypothetical protein
MAAAESKRLAAVPSLPKRLKTKDLCLRGGPTGMSVTTDRHVADMSATHPLSAPAKSRADEA